MNRSALILTSVCVIVIASGCASTPRPKKSANGNAKLIEMRRAFKRQQLVIDDLREKNQVLSARIKDGPRKVIVEEAPVNPPAPVAAPASTASSSSSAASIDVSGEQLAYEKVLEAYGKHDSVAIRLSTEQLIRAIPDSVYADNALYLAARLALEKQDRTVALSYLNRLLRQYPEGNKAVSALFLRSIVQKQVGEFDKAKRDLNAVARLYPGSPEAQRVRWELKTFATEPAGATKRM